MVKREFSGIYRIRNLLDNRSYIGQALNLRNRKSVNFCELRKNKYRNIHLQRAFNKYGEDARLNIIKEEGTCDV